MLMPHVLYLAHRSLAAQAFQNPTALTQPVALVAFGTTMTDRMSLPVWSQIPQTPHTCS